MDLTVTEKKPLEATEWPWLADQLVEWPTRRVHPERTMSIGALHEMGANVIRKAVAIEAAARAMLEAFGGNVPDWLQSEADALENALAGIMPKTQAQLEADALMAFEALGGTIDQLGGNCPVQAEGTIDGKRFYFRARGSSWQFHVAETEAEIFDNPLFYVEADYGTWPDAGWMPEHEAVHFIIVSSAAYRLERELRDAHEGQGNGGDFLAWVRNMADNNTGTLQNAARAYLQATS